MKLFNACIFFGMTNIAFAFPVVQHDVQQIGPKKADITKAIRVWIAAIGDVNRFIESALSTSMPSLKDITRKATGIAISAQNEPTQLDILDDIQPLDEDTDDAIASFKSFFVFDVIAPIQRVAKGEAGDAKAVQQLLENVNKKRCDKHLGNAQTIIHTAARVSKINDPRLNTIVPQPTTCDRV